jgi:hypothetical protein
MARQPALNEDALVKLGADKLARLVIDEAKRNAAFRKLVMAALAASKGPEAIAAIVDKRLAGLERAKSFIDWEKAKALTADLAATIAAIIGELGPADPDAAIDRLVRFLSTADQVFQRVDDSTGRLQAVYHEAAAAVPGLVGQLDEGLGRERGQDIVRRPEPQSMGAAGRPILGRLIFPGEGGQGLCAALALLRGLEGREHHFEDVRALQFAAHDRREPQQMLIDPLGEAGFDLVVELDLAAARPAAL